MSKALLTLCPRCDGEILLIRHLGTLNWAALTRQEVAGGRLAIYPSQPERIRYGEAPAILIGRTPLYSYHHCPDGGQP